MKQPTHKFLLLGMAVGCCRSTRLTWVLSSLHSWVFSSQAKHHQPCSNSQLVSQKIFEFVNVSSYSSLVLGITKGVNAANYVFWLHGLQPTVRTTPENETRGPLGADCVDLNDVRFSYPLRPEIPVLRGVDLKVSYVRISGSVPIAQNPSLTDSLLAGQQGSVCCPRRRIRVRQINHHRDA